MQCLKAAVSAGADAIYIGAERFGARAYAENFDGQGVCDAIDHAHLFGRRLYLTLNTLLKESELMEVADYVRPFYESGLDGVIVQDFGVLSVLREHFTDMELHASTQMTVTGVNGAKLLRHCGVCRVVPARELSLDEIIRIKKEADVEVETFIHGAMCYSYSGQCLFSSFLGGRSGNRGRCAGPCRLPYDVLRGEDVINKRSEQYPLSLKDMCVLRILPRLMESGIDSFKIEGRMKSPEYVAGVTSIYRKYMDLYDRDPLNYSVGKQD
ncbi:MAG: U32 family peptidase, partial [Lachnospiraceae bacterium]|nr:U32 family peptidase [Lachnospiraceae bacterium]